MNNLPHTEMMEATRLTRAGQLAEATALLQRLLRNEPESDRSPKDASAVSATAGRRNSVVIDLVPAAADVQPLANSEGWIDTPFHDHSAASVKGTTHTVSG